MAESIKEAFLTKLLDSVPVLLIVVGVALALLGLAGGITYNSWFIIDEPIARIVTCVLGVVLIGIGVTRSPEVKPTTLRPSDYGIKIHSPGAGEQVDSVDVRGAIERPLPDGYCLRIFRVYPGTENFVPLGKARIDLGKKSWVADRCTLGGKTGDKRALAAYIVGPSGEVLINFHNSAASVHRVTMEELRKATGATAEFLPTIAGRTADMFECDRVSLVRS